MSSADVDRAVRRREWVRLHHGVYVAHTGPTSWSQRAWAAVLATAPSVLAGASALRAHEEAARANGGPGRRRGPAADHEGPIEVAVDVDRHVVPPLGVVLRRRRHLDERASWEHAPPRLQYAEALVDLALSAGTHAEALGWVTDAIGAGRTQATRVGAALRRRDARSRRARWLLSVLEDVAAGTASVLEQGYLDHVVRPHGLPIGRRQGAATVAGRPCLRDIDLPDLGLVVELDGRLHERSSTRRAADLERDLEAAAREDRRTVRLGHAQVFDRSCRTAALLGRLMRRLGWRGTVRACGPSCTATGPARFAA